MIPPYQTGKTVQVHAKHYKTLRGRTHGAGCVRQWFHTAEPLGERRYENWNTHTHTDVHTNGRTYRGHGCVPLRFVGNVVMRIGTQQQDIHTHRCMAPMNESFVLLRLI